MTSYFDYDKILTIKDADLAAEIVGGWTNLRQPDRSIEPDGTPYLYRWEIIPRRKLGGNIYFHVQVASDPERPLHDHPWHNQSVILAGAYDEVINSSPPWGRTETFRRVKGDTIQRSATEAHRLILPEGVPYAMTLFTTGPVIRDWGFWFNNHRGRPDWVSEKECIVVLPDGRSIFKEPVR